MISRKKHRTFTFNRIVIFILLMLLAAWIYSYYLQSKKPPTVAIQLEQETTDGSLQSSSLSDMPHHHAGVDGNDELNKLTCNDGLYADLLVRYGMFDYEKFKAKTDHCTVNSPFPANAGICGK